MYVYSGGTADKVAAIKASPMQTVDENGLRRGDVPRSAIRSSSVPHNLFALMEPLLARDQVQSHTPPPALFTFLAGGQPFNGTPASQRSRSTTTPTPSTRGTRPVGVGSVRRSSTRPGQVKPTPSRNRGRRSSPCQRHRAEDRRRERQGAARRRRPSLGVHPGQVHRGDMAAVRPRRRDRVRRRKRRRCWRSRPGQTWVDLNIGDDPTITP